MRNMLLALSFGLLLFGCTKSSEEFQILATNSWTAAYVGTPCVSLAPADMIHPPEYELSPGDFQRIHHSKNLVFAGYESMMREIGTSAEIDPQALLQIKTGYSMGTIEESLLAIAERMDTTEYAQQSVKHYSELFNEKKEIFQQLGIPKVVFNVHQLALAKQLGFQVLGVFGPAPLEMGELQKFMDMPAHLIIDNGHNPIAQPLKELLPQAVYVQCINFPGEENSKTLEDVIELNTRRIEEVLY
jgi:hypothetical protein